MWVRPLARRLLPKLQDDPLCRLVSQEKRDSPLAGVRVLDLTRIIAGPYCSMILGDLGAEVIKIEEVRGGDEARKWGAPVPSAPGLTCYFSAVNRNKKSVCVNFKTPQGQELLHDLARESDVLIENYTPGVLDRYRLGYDQIREIAPRVVYCSVTGYGSRGPYKNKPGYDVIAASLGGLLHITGPEDGAPCKVGVPVTDMMTGLYAHGAILAALLHRQKTGQGQKVECDLLSTQLSSLINVASNYLNAGMHAKRWGTAHVDVVPYEVFETKDGHLTLGTGSDKQFARLCELMELREMVEDERFKTNADRVANRKVLIPALKERLRTKTTASWLEIFRDAPFPHAPVNTIQQVFDDPHVREIGIVEEVESANGGRLKVVGPAVQYSAASNQVRSPPPLLGQHTHQVLQSVLRLTDQQIQALRDGAHIR
ncbi:succinyl-CoA:glutarate CoA-transferase [Bemisia tabaci]